MSSYKFMCNKTESEFLTVYIKYLRFCEMHRVQPSGGLKASMLLGHVPSPLPPPCVHLMSFT